MSKSGPQWKFWHPLSFWKVLLIFFVAQIGAGLLVASVCALLDLSFSSAASGGVGGATGALIVIWLASQRRQGERAKASRIRQR